MQAKEAGHTSSNYDLVVCQYAASLLTRRICSWGILILWVPLYVEISDFLDMQFIFTSVVYLRVRETSWKFPISSLLFFQ
jgi:hypothetical protein